MRTGPSKVICPYCGKRAVLVDSKVVYGRSYGPIWWCQPCDAYVGVHKNSADHVPLGTLANKELREIRKQAHAAFDPLWKSGKMSRDKAYRVLHRIVQISREEGHIGRMNIDQCKRLIEGLKELPIENTGG